MYTYMYYCTTCTHVLSPTGHTSRNQIPYSCMPFPIHQRSLRFPLCMTAHCPASFAMHHHAAMSHSKIHLALAASLILCTVHSKFVPPDSRDCGKGITCFPCQPAASHAVSPPDCSAPAQRRNGTCQSNSNHKLVAFNNSTSPDDCCARCAAYDGCISWTHYQSKHCNLFSTPPHGINSKDKTCVSGAASWPPAPAPPSPPTPVPAPGPVCTDCPNIVLMFTDDQDQTIGGWEPMTQTQQIFSGGGMTASQWTIHTPICAPSRAELMTGRYYRHVQNEAQTPPSKLCGSGAVGHLDLNGKVYPNTFVRQLREQKGYATGLFGKCMNGNCHNPPSMHGAFDRWFEGTGFYDGDWYDDGKMYKDSGYGTSLIGNKTIEWIRSLQAADTSPGAQRRPFFVYLAPHAPHSPSTPAKWYANACNGTIAPRNPAFNWSTPAFHNLVSRQPPLDAADVSGIDTLARKRCQALLSVDDTYAGVHAALSEMGLLNNTYFLITSDHGYNLGHHRLPSNKFLLYEHSLRIPMIFYGPGIKPNSTTDFLGTQVDLAPTILGLAGIQADAGIDGRSIVPLLVREDERVAAPASVLRHLDSLVAAGLKPPSRTSSFHTYYNQGPWEVGKPHALDDWSNTYIGVSFNNGTHRYKYAEYDPYGKQTNFSSPYLYELFDLVADPFELHNIYNTSAPELRAMLHETTRRWWECQGPSCM